MPRGFAILGLFAAGGVAAYFLGGLLARTLRSPDTVRQTADSELLVEGAEAESAVRETEQFTREIRLTNTLSGKKEILKTLVPGKLTMYSCGPTVWGPIHVGNLRTALASDLFFRYLKRAGYEVEKADVRAT